MLTKQGSQNLAVRHLEQAYAVATSEEARTQIRYKLAQLRGNRLPKTSPRGNASSNPLSTAAILIFPRRSPWSSDQESRRTASWRHRFESTTHREEAPP